MLNVDSLEFLFFSIVDMHAHVVLTCLCALYRFLYMLYVTHLMTVSVDEMSLS